MFAVVKCLDNPALSAQREGLTEVHRAYLRAPESCVRLAGPLLDDDGKAKGSLLVLEVADLDEARRFIDGDPFAEACIFQSVEIEPYKPTIKRFD